MIHQIAISMSFEHEKKTIICYPVVHIYVNQKSELRLVSQNFIMVFKVPVERALVQSIVHCSVSLRTGLKVF